MVKLVLRSAGSRSSDDATLIAEVIANAWVAFKRLMERGLERVIYATPLAGYAIRQVRSGRRVGTMLNVRDVTSEYCQRSKGVKVERLDSFDDGDAEWREMLVEDRQATPADIAACRLDFAAWLETLPGRQRRIAETLSTGETTKVAAKKFRISPARISQIRREVSRELACFHRG